MSSYRPILYFEKDVIVKLLSDIKKYQTKGGHEFAGLLFYERLSDGLKIKEYDKFGTDDVEMDEGAVNYSDEVLEYIEKKSRRHQFIHFHSHPNESPRINESGGWDLPSESDIKFMQSNKQGIIAIGYEAPNKDFWRDIDAGIYAVAADQNTNPPRRRRGHNVKYLPIKVVKNDKDVTENFKPIIRYNKALKFSLEEYDTEEWTMGYTVLASNGKFNDS